MKYISIDIETTGLDPELCNVLSIGAVIEDSANPLPYEECPKFHAAILRHELNGSPRAITMNAKLIADIGAYMEPATSTSRVSLEKETGMIFLNPDEDLPNLLKCKERAGIQGIVTHNALEDAWDVVEVLRTKY